MRDGGVRKMEGWVTGVSEERIVVRGRGRQ